MSKLLSYSGLVTKIRAMQSQLLTDDQYRELAEMTSVPMAVAWLRQKPTYKELLSGQDESTLHRGDVEKHLTNTIYNDYASIYRFANIEQRKFLSLYFKRYEIAILKNCLNKIFDHRDLDLDLDLFKNFFDKHSHMDIELLASSTSLDQFIFNLQGTEYYLPLHRLQEMKEASLFDYETALDLYYFRSIWKVKDKLFKKKDLEQLTAIYGNKFDMLNLQFIHRSKKFFQMTPADIYALIIPIHYKLTKNEIIAMAEAEGDDAFQEILKKSYYGKHYDLQNNIILEDVYIYSMKHILSRQVAKQPYGVASMYQYLYLKDHEIRRLTVALECIRYGLTADLAMQHILKF